MEFEKQVCGLELAKRLKEWGIRQESLFRWLRTENTWFVAPMLATPDALINHGEWYSAFTVAELGELLPWQYQVLKAETPSMGQYLGYKIDLKNHTFEVLASSGVIADTEADARAKMLIYLLENKLLEVGK